MGVGPQEEFYNCADIRIGGPVPKSLKKNVYFAPPDPKDDLIVIDKPTVRRKALANEKAGKLRIYRIVCKNLEVKRKSIFLYIFFIE